MVTLPSFMLSNLDRDFYSSLLKSKLSLESRELISIVLNQTAITRNKSIWNKILNFSDSMKTPLNSLKKNGYLVLNSDIFSEVAAEIRLYADKHSLMNKPYGSEPIRYLTEVSKMLSVKRLLNSVDLYSLVSLYLGAPVSIYNVGAWIQYPGYKGKAPNTQLWHRDRDDFSFLKLFMNVNNVTKANGPHAYLPGSHVSNNLSSIFSCASDPHKQQYVNGSIHKFFTDKDLYDLGLNIQPKLWEGPSGLTFLEDTRGFHRAYTPETEPRLMFAVTWSVGKGYAPDNLVDPSRAVLEALHTNTV